MKKLINLSEDLISDKKNTEEALIFWEVIKRYLKKRKFDSSLIDIYNSFELGYYRFREEGFKLSSIEEKVLSQKYNNFFLSVKLDFRKNNEANGDYREGANRITLYNIELNNSGYVDFTLKNERTFIHEYIHFKDQLRYSKQKYTSDWIKDNPKYEEGGVEYYNNPFEFNAHYTMFIESMINSLKREPAHFYRHIQRGYDEFIYELFDAELSMKNRFKWFHDKYKKKLHKRLHQIYILFKEHYPIFILNKLIPSHRVNSSQDLVDLIVDLPRIENMKDFFDKLNNSLIKNYPEKELIEKEIKVIKTGLLLMEDRLFDFIKNPYNYEVPLGSYMDKAKKIIPYLYETIQILKGKKNTPILNLKANLLKEKNKQFVDDLFQPFTASQNHKIRAVLINLYKAKNHTLDMSPLRKGIDIRTEIENTIPTGRNISGKEYLFDIADYFDYLVDRNYLKELSKNKYQLTSNGIIVAKRVYDELIKRKALIPSKVQSGGIVTQIAKIIPNMTLKNNKTQLSLF